MIVIKPRESILLACVKATAAENVLSPIKINLP